MTANGESFINFYNPPSKTPVRSGNSHYTADPQLFPLPTHHLHCPHCRAQNEPLLSRFPYQNPAINRPTTSLHTAPSDRIVA